MVATETILELRNISHSGQVGQSSLTQRLFGNVETGLILKDVTLEVKSGEVFAVLGSKGSGKRALLDVVSRRARGATRGQILFERSPLTLSVFQKCCGYVTNRTDLIPSLNTEQTLYYAANLSSGEKVSRYTCSTRVRQMLADLALNQVAHHSVTSLNKSQRRRLVIGIQLIKDPTLLLLDEPTADLDPLSTYLVVSILSSYARRRGRAVVLTMEKPRSDVFPFLDRAAFLCLGDILYAGPTRLMLEYFNSIGFPCPATENPLMYYLCLSTVDRRSRERFMESHAHIVELVDKFKAVGASYLTGQTNVPSTIKSEFKPAKPNCFQVSATLYQRLLASTFNITQFGLAHMVLRLTLFPIFSLLVFSLYINTKSFDNPPVNKLGVLFFSLFGSYICSSITTSYTFSVFRTRYYQEAQEGIYSGPLFLIVYDLFSLPFSLATVAASSRILFQATGMVKVDEWMAFAGLLWTCYFTAEQQTIALLSVVRRSFNAAIASSLLCLLYLVLASGILRSFAGMPEWLFYTSYMTQTHFASTHLTSIFFADLPSNCTSDASGFFPLGCRSAENVIFSSTSRSDVFSGPSPSLALAVSASIANLVLYILPLPGFVKAKFRE
ncbi:ATP-binding cassette sub-family G member 5 [Cimex lectularius]|uniref:ABC transporter domain-containing protein n=1 Tax=Cimex lectularius TaxID=79782 RepID=A0A8I6S6F9_CIMLE|nr:ATP-binding cassette sub-family G member 5 [Cimex lectularius]